MKNRMPENTPWSKYFNKNRVKSKGKSPFGYIKDGQKISCEESDFSDVIRNNEDIIYIWTPEHEKCFPFWEEDTLLGVSLAARKRREKERNKSKKLINWGTFFYFLFAIVFVPWNYKALTSFFLTTLLIIIYLKFLFRWRYANSKRLLAFLKRSEESDLFDEWVSDSNHWPILLLCSLILILILIPFLSFFFNLNPFHLNGFLSFIEFFPPLPDNVFYHSTVYLLLSFFPLYFIGKTVIAQGGWSLFFIVLAMSTIWEITTSLFLFPLSDFIAIKSGILGIVPGIMGLSGFSLIIYLKYWKFLHIKVFGFYFIFTTLVVIPKFYSFDISGINIWSLLVGGFIGLLLGVLFHFTKWNQISKNSKITKAVGVASIIILFTNLIFLAWFRVL